MVVVVVIGGEEEEVVLRPGLVELCVCVCVTSGLHLLYRCSLFFGWRLQVNRSDAGWFLHTDGQRQRANEQREEVTKEQIDKFKYH